MSVFESVRNLIHLTLVIALLSAALLVASQAGADIASPPASRLGLLESAPADFALRLELIQSARETIDLTVSEYDTDAQIGMPLLLALRDAAKRGVKVRLLTAYFSSVFAHSTQALKLVLNDDSLLVRPEMILDGEWFKTPIHSPDANMWTSFDEKLLIADKRRAVIGGRNVGEEYLKWLDNSLYLDGPIVTRLQSEFFDPTWDLAASLFGKGRRDIAPGNPRKHERYGKFKLTPVLASGQEEGARIGENPQYTPDRIEILTNGLIAREVAAHGKKTVGEMPDAISERFLELAAHSKRAYYYSLYPNADPRLVKGLTAAATSGSQVALMTNSLQTSRTLTPLTLPYDAGIDTMLELARGGVKVYQWVATPDLVFMHEKLAVIDDVVIYGSHNFNDSGTHGNDELDLEIHDAGLAQLLAERFEAQAQTHAVEVGTDFLAKQKRRHALGIAFGKLFPGLF